MKNLAMTKNVLSSRALLLMALASAQVYAQASDLSDDRPPEAKFSVQINPEFSSGKYGGSKVIEDRYFGMALRYDTPSWTFKATLPYLQAISDSSITRIEPGRIRCRKSGTVCTTTDATTTTVTDTQTKTGVGDASASVTYHLPEMNSGLNIDFIARGKFDTAPADSGFGSGRNDFSLATSVAYEMGNWEPSIEVGYKQRGKSADPDLLNETFVTLGSKIALTKSMAIDVAYEFHTKAFADESAAKAISLSLSSRLTRHWKVEAYYVNGLSDVVADRVIGFSTAYRF